MKDIIKKISQGLLLVPALALGFSMMMPVVVSGADPNPTEKTPININEGAGAAKGDSVPEQLFGASSIFTTVVNILLFLVGAVAVIMLIIGGIRYILSNGDQNSVTSAKNTILYAIIGIIVAILAYAAVNFVITTLIPTSSDPANP